MKNPWKVILLILAIYMLAPLLAFAAVLAPNQIPVHVGLIPGETNTPFVSVTLCEPGTNNCKTIDKIKLDTGSVGLRIFNTPPGLKFPFAPDGKGRSIYECLSFYGNPDGSGGNNNWGSVRLADVRLGKDLGKNLRVQFHEDQAPKDCVKSMQDPNYSQINGILGIGIAKDDCTYGGKNPEACAVDRLARYYTCGSSSCERMTSGVAAVSVQNPLFYFEKNNSGYVLEFPALTKPQSTFDGILSLGINTSANNQLETTKNSKMSLEPNGWILLTQDNKTVLRALLDSGTGYYFVPGSLQITPCQDPYPSIFLCPAPSKQLQGHFLDHEGYFQGEFSAQIEPPRALVSQGYLALPNLGLKGPEQRFILGIPFFYGKKIFFGFPQPDDSHFSNGFVSINSAG